MDVLVCKVPNGVFIQLRFFSLLAEGEVADNIACNTAVSSRELTRIFELLTQESIEDVRKIASSQILIALLFIPIDNIVSQLQSFHLHFFDRILYQFTYLSCVFDIK
jgi:hypothetical protein